MKIGLNATCFNNRASGATQRFKGIYRELFTRLSNTEFVVFQPNDCDISSWFDKTENVSFRQTPLSSQNITQRFLRGLLFWPSIFSRERFDIFEGFNLPAIRVPKSRTILTIHDIRAIRREGVLTKCTYKLFEQSLRNCDRLIVVSESVRNEILSIYPNTPINVVYNGVDPGSFQAWSCSDLQSVCRRYNLPDHFILSVGHFEKRKNYINLVSAIKKLLEKRRFIQLVIVGNDNGELVAIKKHIRRLGIVDNVKILTGASDFEVSCFYRLCKLFVFPSLYEGFGVPILEAMAAECPMVLSNIPVFKELTQGQAVYFEWNNPDAIASAVDDVLSSPSECDRLVQYGKERLRDFSFKKTTIALENVYRTIT